jgi:dihydroxy-acid dehydratase
MDGDEITIDVAARTVDVGVDGEVLAARIATWTPGPPAFRSAVLEKFRTTVADASSGAITNPLLPLQPLR